MTLLQNTEIQTYRNLPLFWCMTPRPARARRFYVSFGEQALSQLYRKLVPLTAAVGGIGHPRNGVVWG